MKIQNKILNCILLIILLTITSILPVKQKCIASSVKLYKKNISLTVDKSFQNYVKNTDELIEWKSSDKKIATVNEDGLIKAKSKGNTKITAILEDGEKLVCKVCVKSKTKSHSSKSTKKTSIKKKSSKTKYVLNNNTMKYHYPECRDVDKIANENYEETSKSAEKLEDEGYSTCGHCTGK